jgi:hypothetical protein
MAPCVMLADWICPLRASSTSVVKLMLAGVGAASSVHATQPIAPRLSRVMAMSPTCSRRDSRRNLRNS